MRTYETMYIVHPDKAGEALGEVVGKFRKVIEDLGGSVVKVDEWGLRKLAYPIQKQGRGNYVLMTFEAKPDDIVELERRLRIDDNIMRFQTMRVEEVAEVVAAEQPSEAAEEAPAEAEEAGE